MSLSKWAAIAARKGRLDCVACIAYDGLGTSGYQLQPTLTLRPDSTIESRILSALREAAGETPSLTSVSRTDADVSAKCQLVRFGLSESAVARYADNAMSLAKALNDAATRAGHPLHFNKLRFCRPSQIQLRHCVTWKQYSYYVVSAAAEKEAQQTLRAAAPRRMLVLAGPLNVAAMQRSLRHLLGTHDFGLLGLDRELSPSNFKGKRAVHMRKALSDAAEAAGAAPDVKRPARDISAGATASAVSGARGISSSRTGADEQSDGEDSLSVISESVDAADDGESKESGAAAGSESGTEMPHKDKALRRALLAAVTTVRTLDVAELTLVPLEEVNLDLTDTVTPERPEVDFSSICDASTAVSCCTRGSCACLSPAQASPVDSAGRIDPASAPASSSASTAASAAALPSAGSCCSAHLRVAAATYGRPGGPGSGGKPLYALRFRFGGDGFLRHQVRFMVGIAIAVGRGTLPEDIFRRVLAAADEKAHAASAAAAAATTDTCASTSPAAAGDATSSGGATAFLPTARAMSVTAAASAAASTSAAGAAAGGSSVTLSASERLRAILGTKSVPKAAGGGLLLERLRVPEEMWSDEDFTNNTSPVYLADTGLTLHTIAKARRRYDLPAVEAEAGAGRAPAAAAASFSPAGGTA